MANPSLTSHIERIKLAIEEARETRLAAEAEQDIALAAKRDRAVAREAETAIQREVAFLAAIIEGGR